MPDVILSIPGASVCAVVLTYGDRFHLLERVVRAALAGGASKVVLVDNGAHLASKEKIEVLQRSLDALEVVSLPENKGSAGGYKAGLEHACRTSDCDYIWLLDDDNRPAKDALKELFKHYRELSASYAPDRLALLSMREDRENLKKVAAGAPAHKIFPKRSHFMGFHVLDVPAKVLKLLGQRKGFKDPSSLARPVAIPYGVYGGLFFSKAALAQLGYPDEHFFVYGDDVDYTYRFTQDGGALFLIPSSTVEDIDRSWHARAKGEDAYTRLLHADSDFRIYYAVRNEVFLARHRWFRSPTLYALNKASFLAILRLFAHKDGKEARLKLIREAIKDGECGRLGRRAGLNP